MSFVERKRKESEEQFEKMRKMYRIPDKYKDCSDLFFKGDLKRKLKMYLSRNKDLRLLIKDWNSTYDNMQYVFPKELGEELEKNFNDENYTLVIHRTPYTGDEVNTFFKDGVIMRSQSHSSNLQSFMYFPLLLYAIAHCHGFKDSNGCIIAKLPKEQTLPIYFEDKYGKKHLLPEYIYGYVGVENYKPTYFIKNPGYTDIHDYQPDGLYYDDEIPVVNKEKGKTI